MTADLAAQARALYDRWAHRGGAPDLPRLDAGRLPKATQSGQSGSAASGGAAK